MPVGFTFSEPRYFGYDVFYRYGPPIHVDQYLDLYKTDPQKALQAVIDDLKVGMEDAMIVLHIDEGESVFDDATIADAIMDRLTAKASRIELKGKSLRKRS